LKERKFLERMGDFVLGRGFYIVLFLCVAAIGVSGYYLLRSVALPGAELTGGDTSVVLPDSEANGPDPVGSLPSSQTGGTGGSPMTIPTQPDEPQTGGDEPTKEPDTPQSEQNPEPESGGQVQEQEPEQTAPKPGKPAAAVYTWPVKGEILRDFSVETLSHDPTMGDWRTHGGLDIAAALGTKVLAMSDGTVTDIRQDGLMGTTVVIDHGNGVRSTYCGLAGEPAVRVGDTVTTGKVIGGVGETAIAESGLVSHLHLEVSLQGVPVDPMNYLPKLG